MNLWSTLSWWSISGTLCLFPFVFICGNSDCVSLILDHALRLNSSLSVTYACVPTFDLPLFWTLRVIGEKDKWRRPSLSVRPSSRLSRAWAARKLSIKCFCWGREKIWYSGETKVICTRKFNCLSPASLSFSLASPTKSISHESSSDEVQRWVCPAASLPLHRSAAAVYLCLYERARMTHAHFLKRRWVPQ